MKKLKLTSLALLCVLFSCSQNASSSLKDKESQETSYSTSEQQESINSQTTNETSTLNQTSSSENSSSSSFQSSFEGINTPYETKMNAYFDGATIQDTNFVNKVKTLGEYDSSKEVTNNVIYASPDGNGDGSFNSPYELQEAFDNLKPGMTLYLKGGTYDRKNGDGYFINCQGREDAYVSIRPYKDEKVIITNSSRGKESYGFQVDGNSCYFILENIEIKDIKGNSACGIAFWGNNQNHIIIRNCEVHHIETTSTNPEKDTNAGANAILLFGEQSKAINNVALINNYCHDNINGWSENISVSGNCEYIYVLENRVENNTNIGIDFYGNAGYCSTKELDQPRYCLAAKNYIYHSDCSYADCAGLYVDGARDILLQYNEVVDCQYGIEIGSEERQDNYPVKNIIVRSNLCHDNRVTALRIGGYEENATGVVKDTLILNNTFIDNSLETKYAEVIFAKVDNIELKNNLILKKTSGSFIATDFNENYTKNLKFTNNLIYQLNVNESDVNFAMFNKEQIGVNAFNSLFNCQMIYQEFTVDNNFISDSPYVINKGESDSSLGNYDFNLNQRVKNNVDIGAIEA